MGGAVISTKADCVRCGALDPEVVLKATITAELRLSLAYCSPCFSALFGRIDDALNRLELFRLGVVHTGQKNVLRVYLTTTRLAEAEEVVDAYLFLFLKGVGTELPVRQELMVGATQDVEWNVDWADAIRQVLTEGES